MFIPTTLAAFAGLGRAHVAVGRRCTGRRTTASTTWLSYSWPMPQIQMRWTLQGTPAPSLQRACRRAHSFACSLGGGQVLSAPTGRRSGCVRRGNRGMRGLGRWLSLPRTSSHCIGVKFSDWPNRNIAPTGSRVRFVLPGMYAFCRVLWHNECACRAASRLGEFTPRRPR
jgi:hypothetical protein